MNLVALAREVAEAYRLHVVSHPGPTVFGPLGAAADRLIELATERFDLLLDRATAEALLRSQAPERPKVWPLAESSS